MSLGTDDLFRICGESRKSCDKVVVMYVVAALIINSEGKIEKENGFERRGGGLWVLLLFLFCFFGIRWKGLYFRFLFWGGGSEPIRF